MFTNRKAIVVIGVQYGDEGKGKLVDKLAEKANLVCRVQGGNNAGHTIKYGDKKIVTHLIPSGVLHDNCNIALGAGMVIEPFALKEEIENLQNNGIDLSPKRLHIDLRAQVILPYHKLEDIKREKLKKSIGEVGIGTTGKGIGPAYASRAYRESPRMADLCDRESFDYFLNQNPHIKEGLTSEIKENLLQIAEYLKPFMCDVALLCNNRMDAGKKVLFEGAQGSMLDISFGSYPFVTSSNLLAGAIPGAVGIAPYKIGRIVGVTKAYSTRVGNGPFIGELDNVTQDLLRQKGQEFGSTTGRARRIGWLDLVALQYFSRLNGLTDLALMKSDILNGFEKIGLVVGYKNKVTDKIMEGWPMTISALEKVEPIIEYVNGWESLYNKRNVFNKEFKNYISKIKKYVKLPISYISTGQERNEGIFFSQKSDK